jgi:hypothetical protein
MPYETVAIEGAKFAEIYSEGWLNASSSECMTKAYLLRSILMAFTSRVGSCSRTVSFNLILDDAAAIDV